MPWSVDSIRQQMQQQGNGENQSQPQAQPWTAERIRQDMQKSQAPVEEKEPELVWGQPPEQRESRFGIQDIFVGEAPSRDEAFKRVSTPQDHPAFAHRAKTLLEINKLAQASDPEAPLRPLSSRQLAELTDSDLDYHKESLGKTFELDPSGFLGLAATEYAARFHNIEPNATAPMEFLKGDLQIVKREDPQLYEDIVRRIWTTTNNLREQAGLEPLVDPLTKELITRAHAEAKDVESTREIDGRIEFRPLDKVEQELDATLLDEARRRLSVEDRAGNFLGSFALAITEIPDNLDEAARLVNRKFELGQSMPPKDQIMGHDVSQKIRENMLHPALADSTLETKLPGMMGFLTFSMATGGAGGLAGLGIRGSTALMGGTFAANEIGNSAREYKEMGVDDDVAFWGSMARGGVSALNAIPLSMGIQRGAQALSPMFREGFKKRGQRFLLDTLAIGTSEAAINSADMLASDLVDRHFVGVHKDRDVLPELPEMIGMSYALGAVTGGMGRLIGSSLPNEQRQAVETMRNEMIREVEARALDPRLFDDEARFVQDLMSRSRRHQTITPRDQRRYNEILKRLRGRPRMNRQLSPEARNELDTRFEERKRQETEANRRLTARVARILANNEDDIRQQGRQHGFTEGSVQSIAERIGSLEEKLNRVQGGARFRFHRSRRAPQPDRIDQGRPSFVSRRDAAQWAMNRRLLPREWNRRLNKGTHRVDVRQQDSGLYAPELVTQQPGQEGVQARGRQTSAAEEGGGIRVEVLGEGGTRFDVRHRDEKSLMFGEVEGDTLRITAARTDPDVQRRGRFTSLMSHMAREAREQFPNIRRVEGDLVGEASVAARQRFPSTRIQTDPQTGRQRATTDIEDVIEQRFRPREAGLQASNRPGDVIISPLKDFGVDVVYELPDGQLTVDRDIAANVTGERQAHRLHPDAQAVEFDGSKYDLFAHLYNVQPTPTRVKVTISQNKREGEREIDTFNRMLGEGLEQRGVDIVLTRPFAGVEYDAIIANPDIVENTGTPRFDDWIPPRRDIPHPRAYYPEVGNFRNRQLQSESYRQMWEQASVRRPGTETRSEHPAEAEMRALGDPQNPQMSNRDYNSRLGRMGDMIRTYFTAQPYKDIVRLQGPGGERASQMAEEVISERKQLAGEMSQLRRRALAQFEGFHGRSKEVRDAIRWSEEVRDHPQGHGEGYGMSNLYAALEGKIPLEDVPKPLRPFIRHTWGVHKWGADKLVEVGALQLNRDTGQAERFVPRRPDGKLALRPATRELIDLLYQGAEAGPVWDLYTKAIAETNNMNAQQVRRVLEQYTGRPTSRIGPEVSRLFQYHPTHLIHNGRKIPLLETHPVAYLDTIIQNFSSRVPIIRRFGQDLAMTNPDGSVRESQFDRTKRQLVSQGASSKDLDRMLRQLSDLPLHMPIASRMPVGSDGYYASYGYRSFESLAKAHLLTRAFVPQISEMLGTMRTQAGLKRWGKGLAQWRKAFNDPRNLVEIVRGLEREGAIARDRWHNSFDPDRLIRSLSKEYGDLILRVAPTIQAWEGQQISAAMIGQEMVKDMQAGRSTTKDYLLLREHNFTEQQAERMVNGHGTREEYFRFVRSFGARSNTTNMTLRAEKSHLASSGPFQTFFWFTEYPQMVVRNTWRISETAFDETRRYIAGDRSAKQAKRVFWANERVLEQFMGLTAAGVGTNMLLSLVAGGTEGFKNYMRDFRDNPGAVAAEGLMAGILGPILRSVWFTLSSGDRSSDIIPRTLASAMAPVSVGIDITSAIAGLGRYRDYGPLDRSLMLFDRITPGTDLVAFGAMSMGLQDKSFENARQDIYNWARRNEVRPGHGRPGDIGPEEQISRRHIRQAVNLLQSESMLDQKNYQKFREEIMAAVGAEDYNQVADRLEGHRILTRFAPEDRIKYRRYNEEAWDTLRKHDQLLSRTSQTLRAIQDAEERPDLVP